ncbi:MAG: aminotransferase class IV [Arcobacter sp.]|nr:aminotransferase class IV [Arcobacter sp.]
MTKYFETIKIQDYEIFNLPYHEKRIAKTIGLNICLQEYIYPPSNELLRCKVIYDESGILDIEYFPYEKKQIKSFKIIFDDKIEYSKKYLDRKNIDVLYEKKEDCDEIIIVKNDIVTDTSIANVAILYDDRWIVSKDSLLEGTTKARLLEEKKLIKKDISLEMLKKAPKIALLNAMIGFDILEDYSFSL